MTQYDLPAMYDFLHSTPEQGLRKMLVDGKPMTDVHFQMLMKIVRNVSCEDFCKHVEANDFPKIKMGPAEVKLKEKLWKDCFHTFQQRGLLNPAQPKKAA